jgi:hypothetical protein
MKLDTVNVIQSSDGVPNKIISYPDTEDGNKQAEDSFLRAIDALSIIMTETTINAEMINDYIDDGKYECDGESVYLIHS